MSESFTLGLWNANGLQTTYIHDVLSHCLSFTALFITETWMLPPSRLPTEWLQFHTYGVPVEGHYRGSQGITALISPHCSYPVSQVSLSSPYALGILLGPIKIICLYLPPSLSTDEFHNILTSRHCNSMPVTSNTILCGDFNARMGDITGDYASNTRGTMLHRWLTDRNLTLLNSTLSYGTPTFLSMRHSRPVSSIIDFFITDLPLTSPSIDIDLDLSLGSDHKLLSLSFSYTSSSPTPSAPPPRHLWHLSRLRETDTHKLYVRSFTASSQSLLSDLR
ncbi:Endonuclease/exonuclease/phosphatase, partial [Radiomyces spectabilis]|uniref:Endonuclease/exonuclease/phosphatase n=1 Tax=Radiomyces spectabilis TaxID=64574 RepID=UPI00221F3CC2